jgi:hypothetical protein
VLVVLLATVVVSPTGAERSSGISPLVVVATITNAGVTVAPAAVSAGPVTVKVINRSAAARDFRIGGKRTAALRTGHSTFLNVVLAAGNQPYTSTALGRGSQLSGILNVFQPCTNPVATTVHVQAAQGAGGLTVSQTSIPCGTVTFIVSNTGTMVDQLQIFELNQSSAQASTGVLSAGQTQTLTIEFPAEGIAFCQSVTYPPPEPEYGDFSEIAKLRIT